MRNFLQKIDRNLRGLSAKYIVPIHLRLFNPDKYQMNFSLFEKEIFMVYLFRQIADNLKRTRWF